MKPTVKELLHTAKTAMDQAHALVAARTQDPFFGTGPARVNPFDSLCELKS